MIPPEMLGHVLIPQNWKGLRKLRDTSACTCTTDVGGLGSRSPALLLKRAWAQRGSLLISEGGSATGLAVLRLLQVALAFPVLFLLL